MVQVSVSATVSVHAGPMLPVGAELEPDSYVVSGADLDAASPPRGCGSRDGRVTGG